MKSRHHRHHKLRQRGQAVLWFLATIAACCCVFVLVYNVGQVSNKKEETTNAADAAALSGALVEARMLNFEAYTNRAMVANEVTIAQLVSLDSWLRYDNEMMQYIGIYTAPIPYLDAVTSALADASQVASDAFDAAVALAVPAVEAVNTGLTAIQQYAAAIGALAANDVAGQIASANATTFANTATSEARYDEKPQETAPAVILGLNELKWNAFTTAYSGNDRASAAGVILNSRDPFSTERDNGYLIKGINFVLELAGLGLIYDELKKTSGTTELVDYDHWAAQDSLDLVHHSIGLFGTSADPVPIPLAYGRADADSDGSTGKNLCNTTWLLGLPTLNCYLAKENSNNINWGGMPNFRDLAQGLAKTDPCSRNNGSDSPSLTYVMAVQKAGNSTLTAQRMGMANLDVDGPQGSPKMSDNLQNGDNLTAISAACTFFLRPDFNTRDITGAGMARADGVHEYASLFNPHWQARLTAADSDWTTILYALIGKPGLNLATQ